VYQRPGRQEHYVTDDEQSDVIPIDAEIRQVLREFSDAPIALASEIVKLRAELEAQRTDRRQAEIVLQTPEAPPDAPPPTRLEG
jgi:hypothetical protein